MPSIRVMGHVRYGVLIKGILLLLNLGLVGCNNYSLVLREDHRPARLLYWRSSAQQAEVSLHSVIVPDGQGSWVNGARWDEYVVQITNSGSEPLVINSASLIDIQGNPQQPGDDLKKLEKLSSVNWARYGKDAMLVAGVGLAYGIVSTGLQAGVVGLSSGVAGGGAAIGSGMAGGAILSLLLIMPDEDRQPNWPQIRANFESWRFKLPLRLAPGKSLKRSFFFPMTPGPQRLILEGMAGDAPIELVLELKLLAGLHLKPEKKKAKSP